MLRMGDRRYNLYITFSVSLHLCKLAVCYAVPCSGVAPGPSYVPCYVIGGCAPAPFHLLFVFEERFKEMCERVSVS